MNKDSPALKVPELTTDEHRAVKAISDGIATEGQQKLFLSVLVHKLTGMHNLNYVPGSFDETAFMNGRGFVGQQLTKYIKIPIKENN